LKRERRLEDAWQIFPVHQLRDLRHAIAPSDSAFVPRLKTLVRRAVILARRRFAPKESTRAIILPWRRCLSRHP
jgi:hypothetical protein